MKDTGIYWLGVTLVSVGVALISAAAQRQGEQIGRDSVIWTEADKNIKLPETDGTSTR